MVAHHGSKRCNLQPGDLFGSGTASGIGDSSAGRLLEVTRDGSNPVILANSETHIYLADGDEVIFAARPRRTGYVSIQFGEYWRTVTEALKPA